MDVSGASNQTSVPVVSQSKTGFNGLSSEDFLKMMIVQLQNQDPLNPTGNEELLNQISQMRALQTNIELSDVLTAANSQQQLTSAASLLGRFVEGKITGADGTERTIDGIVQRAFVTGGKAFVATDSGELPLESIVDVQ